MMSAEDVLEVVSALSVAGIAVWTDGGWGVDALLGEQTRDHDDLDCVAALSDASSVCAALAPLGFLMHENELPTRFVVRDASDRRIDVHTVTFDDEGAGVQQLQDGSTWRYPALGFLAVGRIAGRPVTCLTADAQALAHIGYVPDNKDAHDMTLLADRFGIELPAPYQGHR